MCASPLLPEHRVSLLVMSLRIEVPGTGELSHLF